MTDLKLALTLLPGIFAICRLEPDSEIPSWGCTGDFFSITRTAEELSIVCRQGTVPAGIHCEQDYRCFRVGGPLDLGLTGILASLGTVLAQADVSVFAVSTFDTDYLLVKEKDVERASVGLSKAGYHVIQLTAGS